MADPTAPQITGFVPSAQTARAYRDALGTFTTGVTVVTAQGAQGPVGFTANSFASVSLDPPLVLWSVARDATRFAVFADADHFAIHILAEDQSDDCRRFARGDLGFAGETPDRNAHGVPVLRNALARFDCRMHARHEGGDHMILVGRVLECHSAGGPPLVFSQGQLGRFDPHPKVARPSP